MTTEQVTRTTKSSEAPAAATPMSPANGRTLSEATGLSAKLEPFDSYWQTPEDVERGYKTFYEYYRHNYLPHMPADKASNILVISCGPGYLVNLLTKQGYTNVLGIDSAPDKIEFARKKQLNCKTAHAFSFLEEHVAQFDVIIPEQELNHLTLDEILQFLALCRSSLRSDGRLMVYALNGANPLVGSENLAHNIDHFNTFTEYSLMQVLKLAEFRDIQILPLKIYVFWKNPLNYVGLAVTGLLELFFRIVFKMYGKNVTVLSKKLAATCLK